MPNQNELKWGRDATTITAKGIGSFSYHIFFMNGGWYAGCLEALSPQWESGDYVSELEAKMRCQQSHNAILQSIEEAVAKERKLADDLGKLLERTLKCHLRVKAFKEIETINSILYNECLQALAAHKEARK